jgi:cell division protein ZapB
MISEFNDLSDKIDRLAELTLSLRRENATLRQSNALLAAENLAFMERLSEAQQRVEALIATIPDDAQEQAQSDDAESVSDDAILDDKAAP